MSWATAALSFFASRLEETQRTAIGNAEFKCPRYAPAQAKQILESGSRVDWTQIDWELHGSKSRDLAIESETPRWTNPENYTPSGSELLIPYRFARDHFTNTTKELIIDSLEDMSAYIG